MPDVLQRVTARLLRTDHVAMLEARAAADELIAAVFDEPSQALVECMVAMLDGFCEGNEDDARDALAELRAVIELESGLNQPERDARR